MFDSLKQKIFTGERALFQADSLNIYDSVFDDGESPLKESRNINLYQSMFRWKYPLWYSRNIYLKDCTLFNTARAGIWYTDNIDMDNVTIDAPKTFRRANHISLKAINFPNDWYSHLHI